MQEKHAAFFLLIKFFVRCFSLVRHLLFPAFSSCCRPIKIYVTKHGKWDGKSYANIGKKIFTKMSCCFQRDVCLRSASTLPLSLGRDVGYNQINHWGRVSKTLTFVCVLLQVITFWVETEISFRHSKSSVDNNFRCSRVINMNETKERSFVAIRYCAILSHFVGTCIESIAARQLRLTSSSSKGQLLCFRSSRLLFATLYYVYGGPAIGIILSCQISFRAYSP